MRIELYSWNGFDGAMNGTMLSYGKTSFDNFEAPEEDKERLSEYLAGLDGGHNKFLEFITYQILVRAPLRWWKQMDTYRVAVSKLSESTMHLSWKGGINTSDFERPDLIFPETIEKLNEVIREYCNCTPDEKDKKKELENKITLNLPEGYLQTRLVCVNAKSLRNIYFQRIGHKLPEWKVFCDFVKKLPKGNLICSSPRL